MFRRRFLLFLFCALLFDLSCQNAIADQETSTTRSIIFAGLERTYHIHIPASYDKANPIPLLIVLHGGGGTGEGMVNLSQGGFNKLSDKEGFIVVYPDGIEKHWNDGWENASYRAHREKMTCWLDVGWDVGWDVVEK